MYRRPDEQADDAREASEALDALAQAGRVNRAIAAQDDAADEARRRAADARTADEASARRADAVAWRFAQRASRSFERLVVAQVLGLLAGLGGIATMVGVSIEAHTARLPIVALAVIALAAWPLLIRYVRARQRAVLAAERAWARDRAHGLTGLVDAIGRAHDADPCELTITVRLGNPPPKREVASLGETLARFSANGTVRRSRDELVITSGKLEPKALMSWTREAVTRLLPKLAPFAITAVSIASDATDWRHGRYD
jgi:hypothetical protein